MSVFGAMSHTSVGPSQRSDGMRRAGPLTLLNLRLILSSGYH